MPDVAGTLAVPTGPDTIKSYEVGSTCLQQQNLGQQKLTTRALAFYSACCKPRLTAHLVVPLHVRIVWLAFLVKPPALTIAQHTCPDTVLPVPVVSSQDYISQRLTLFACVFLSQPFTLHYPARFRSQVSTMHSLEKTTLLILPGFLPMSLLPSRRVDLHSSLERL